MNAFVLINGIDEIRRLYKFPLDVGISLIYNLRDDMSFHRWFVSMGSLSEFVLCTLRDSVCDLQERCQPG